MDRTLTTSFPTEKPDYHPPVPSVLRVKYPTATADDFFKEGPIEQSSTPPELSFYIDPIESPIPYNSFTAALNSVADDVPVWDVELIFDLLRARSDIAKASRRGLGNFIATNDAHIIFAHDSLKHGVTILCDENFDGTFLIYQGNHNTRIDGAILDYDGTFYVHPDYRTLIRKINFV